jgi:Ca2+-binding EF-hand superfamily protein
LNKYEFESFLSKVGMFVSTQEMSELFKFYDKNSDGQIDVSEFLAALQGQLSDRRLEIVKQAWQFLDARGQGRLQKSEILQKFNAGAHPRVPTREKTVEEVKQEFQAALNQYGSGNFITEDDFCSLYLSFNGTIPIEQDTYFTSLLVNVWGLNAQQDFIANERVAELEDILYEKVRQRCKGNDDEGKTMMKVFRYFDTDNTGAISLGEFNRALEQFGCTFNANEVRALFQKYDADNSGQIDYEEFVKVFARKGAAGPNQFGETREAPNAVLDKIMKELLRRGAHGIRGLGIVFRRMDNNRDRHLDRYEFEWGLRENGHRLSALDMERLFKYFDRSKDGKISYDEFLRAIRGDMNERRRNLVLQAYRKLDKNKDGKVNIEDMRIAYDVSFHPNVTAT